MAKIIFEGCVPPDDPMFKQGFQVFTDPHYGTFTQKTPGCQLEDNQVEEKRIEPPVLRLETEAIIEELDRETATANFDKLMDAYEAGGTDAVKERFQEQWKEKNRDVNEQGDDGKDTE